MAKTALDLTPEELRSYQPDLKADKRHTPERHKQALELASKAARILFDEFGATRVAVFGSIIHRDSFGPWSDIDLAVWGIPADQFYRAVGAVTGISQDFYVDLVDPENCRPSVQQSIEREEVDL